MKLEDLKVFIFVADTHSINKATDLLFMSRQNVSKILNRLESELNTTLFSRTNKGVRLTSNGELFYNYAIDIIKRTDLLIASFSIPPQSSLPRSPRPLRILSTINVDDNIISFLYKFMRKNPNIYFELLEKTNSSFTEIIGNSSTIPYDIIFTHIARIPSTEKKLYNFINLWSSNIFLHLLIPIEDRTLFGESIVLEDLYQLPLIMYNESSEANPMKKLNNILQDHNLPQLTPITSSNSYTICIQYVMEHLGYLLYASSKKDNQIINSDLFAIITVEPVILANFSLIMPSPTLRSPEMNLFLKEFLSEFKSGPNKKLDISDINN